MTGIQETKQLKGDNGWDIKLKGSPWTRKFLKLYHNWRISETDTSGTIGVRLLFCSIIDELTKNNWILYAEASFEPERSVGDSLIFKLEERQQQQQ
jgi:hypothetical protein